MGNQGRSIQILDLEEYRPTRSLRLYELDLPALVALDRVTKKAYGRFVRARNLREPPGIDLPSSRSHASPRTESTFVLLHVAAEHPRRRF